MLFLEGPIDMHRSTTRLTAPLLLVLFIAGCASSEKDVEAKPKTVKSVQIGTTPIKPGESKPAPDEPPGPSVVCNLGSSIREIAIVTDDDGCVLNYVKDGASSVIASGGPESTKCREVQEVVRSNLEKAGFACQ